MEQLKTWVITLVTITIICSIIEKFAPQGTLNKYVRLLCGLAVTVVIAVPAIRLLKSDEIFEAMVWKDYLKLSQNEMHQRIIKMERDDSRQILEIYRQSIIRDIKLHYSGENGYTVTQVDAVLVEDSKSKDFGRIRTLYMTLEPGRNNKNKLLKTGTENLIKNHLSEILGIDIENIRIDTGKFNNP